jgi:hypothetical protein
MYQPLTSLLLVGLQNAIQTKQNEVEKSVIANTPFKLDASLEKRALDCLCNRLDCLCHWRFSGHLRVGIKRHRAEIRQAKSVALYDRRYYHINY